MSLSDRSFFGSPIYSDVGATYTPALSGGSWVAALPLANLQERSLAKVARSTNVLAASTQCECDLGVARAVALVALPKHTISAAGQIRVRAYTGPGGTGSLVYDSGTLTVWPAGVTAEDIVGWNLGWFLVLPSAQTARYWLLEITDTTNPAGYLDLARLVLAGGWQPTVNLSAGEQLGVTSLTRRDVTDGGAASYVEGPQRRVQTFAIDGLPETEALTHGFDLQRLAGTSGQIFFVFDPTDTVTGWRRSFLATLRELSALEAPAYQLAKLPFALTEEL